MFKDLKALFHKNRVSRKSFRARSRYVELLENRLPLTGQFNVTTNADDGAGSLRQVIASINAAIAPTDEITLTFSASLPSRIIELQSALPAITGTPG